MTSFAISPLASGSPISGLVALDFGPAALIVGAVLLMIGAALAVNGSVQALPTPPPPARRSPAAAEGFRRLGRSLGRRPERRPLVVSCAGS
jgi:hypothetical protein